MTYQLHPTTDSQAYVRAVNPHPKNHDLELLEIHKDFNKDNPPLPLFHTDNTPVSVKEAREVYQDNEVEVVWQAKLNDGWHVFTNGYSAEYYANTNISTRQIARLTSENVFHEPHQLDKQAGDEESRTDYEEYLDAIIENRKNKPEPIIERKYTNSEVDKWIRVKDELPPCNSKHESEPLQCYSSLTGQFVGWYDCQLKIWRATIYTSSNDEIYVTHWRQLKPNPLKTNS